MNGSYSTQNSLLLNNLMEFYKTNNNLSKMLKIITGESKISLRIVDWFATNYAKKHYTLYSNQTPIIQVTKDIIRRWLFNLHDQVNQHNQKESISYDSIISQYEVPFNFTQHFKNVLDHMTLAVRRGICIHNDVQRTIRFFTEMKCFYDFF